MTEHEGDPPNLPSIGLSFIFRNDEETIENMLDSFLPFVHEVVAVNTGCTDSSIEIVKQKLGEFHGRTLILETEWVENFSTARQVGWDALNSEWGLWCDADDTVVGGETFLPLIKKADEHHGNLPIGGFIFKYDYARTPTGENVCILPRERLVRMGVGWKWASPVHEVLIAQTPCEFVSVDSAIWIHHKVPSEMQGDRNINIIKRHVAEAKAASVEPDPRMVAYLGVEHAARGQHEDAVEAYKWYMKISGWGEEKHQVIHRMADSYRAMGSYDQAIECETYALTHTNEHGVPEWPDHFFGIAEAMMGKQQWGTAILWLERGIPIPMPTSSMILNPRDYDYAPQLMLSLCFYELGHYEKSAQHAQAALEIMPNEMRARAHAHRVMIKQRENRAINSYIEALEHAIAYDENLKAREIIKHLPYVVKGDRRIFELSNHIRRSTYQIGSANGYEHMYETNREVRNPDQWVEDASKRFGRAAMLAQGLQRQADALGRLPLHLDAGCNDGWMGAHMEHEGLVARADGIDLNPTAVAAAIDRKDRLSIRGEFRTGFIEDAADAFPDTKYDAISLFEVFEHLEDPHVSVGRLESALAEGGVMYISTPAGAYEKGLITNWHENENKQHLRAVSNSEFAGFALQRGWLLGMDPGTSIKVMDDGNQIVEGVQVISYEPFERKGHIVFYLGPAWDPWSPDDIHTKGLGGSETAAVKLATGLAAQGWYVEVFGGMTIEGPYDGVLYQNYTMYDSDVHCDVFISSRDASAVSQLAVNAGTKILWLHDAHAGGSLARYARDFTNIMCLTESHEENVRELEGIQDSSYDDLFLRTRNGIDHERFETEGNDPPRKNVVLYSSSPDRGLEQLLAMWPSIVDRVKDARLKIFYGFDIFDQMHSANPAMMAWKSNLVKTIESLKGVELIGRVDQGTLAKEQAASKVWAYPYPQGSPTETSCITAMESMAAGLVCVTTRTGALAETVGNGGILIPGDPSESRYRDRFVNSVCVALVNPVAWKSKSDAAVLRSHEFSWDAVVEQWDDLFSGRLHELRNVGGLTGLPA